MKQFSQFINEALECDPGYLIEVELNGVQRTSTFGLSTGKHVPKEAKHIGTLPNGHHVHSIHGGKHHILNQVDKKRNDYYVSDPKTKRVNTHLVTDTQAKRGVEEVDILAANKKSLGVHHLYQHLVLKHDKVISSRSQSPGARKVWAKAAAHPSINIHGYNHGAKIKKDAAFNMHPTDDDQYVSDSDRQKRRTDEKEHEKVVKPKKFKDKDTKAFKNDWKHHWDAEDSAVVMHKKIK